MPHLDRQERGVVYVEFIISFIPVFTLFLGIVQLCFIAAGKLVVQHAAVMGARSAIVVLEDDDRQRYKDEPFGLISYRGSSSGRGSAVEEKFGKVMNWFRGGNELSFNARPFNPGNQRLRDIRWAVYVPLMAIAPPPDQIARWFGVSLNSRYLNLSSQDSLQGAIGNSPWLRFVSGLAYNRAAAAVTFHDDPGSEQVFAGAFAPTDNVTVRVTYLYHCAVPLVSRFMCDSVLDASGVTRVKQALRDVAGEPGSYNPLLLGELDDRLRQRMGRYTQNFAVFSYAEGFAFTMLLAITDARFAVLRAQATMPIQGADYYRNRGDD